jgi:hypothetical protein
MVPDTPHPKDCMQISKWYSACARLGAQDPHVLGPEWRLWATESDSECVNGLNYPSPFPPHPHPRAEASLACSWWSYPNFCLLPAQSPSPLSFPTGSLAHNSHRGQKFRSALGLS